MTRCILYSSGVHLMLILSLTALGFIHPAERPPKRIDLSHINFIPPGPKRQGKFAPPPPGVVPMQAPPAAAPKPAAPKPAEPAKVAEAATPAPIKHVKKEVAAATKEIIKKDYKVIDKPKPDANKEKPPEPKKEEGKDKDNKDGKDAKAAATPAPKVELPGELAQAPTAPGAKATPVPGAIAGPQVVQGELGFSWGTEKDGPQGGGGGMFQEMGSNYAYIALWHIQQNFHPPYEMPGAVCVVQFKVMKDGTVADVAMKKSSGRTDLDQSAREALVATGNLQPLYDDFSKPYVLAEVTFEFEKKKY